jgi:hypothetical protein
MQMLKYLYTMGLFGGQFHLKELCQNLTCKIYLELSFLLVCYFVN